VIKNTMPDFDNLEIDLSSNSIGQNIVKHDYFSRVTKLNLANNSLVDLDFQIFDTRNLRTLSLLNNPIKTLRKSIQNLYICAISRLSKSGMVFLITVMFKPEQSTTVLFRDG
jgi:Leucine-rich repeat (LRR) protein